MKRIPLTECFCTLLCLLTLTLLAACSGCAHTWIDMQDETYHWKMCTECGSESDREAHALLRAHIAEATCTEAGSDLLLCSCEFWREEEIAPFGHSYGTWEADETTHSRTCTACGIEESAPHTWDGGTRAGDTTVYRCTVCDFTRTEESGSQGSECKEHLFDDWIVTLPAECGEAGRRVRLCLQCGLLQSEIIPPLSHTFGTWQATEAPSCGKAGREQRLCTRCGEIQVQSVAPLEHAFGDWETVSAPSCGKPGAERRICLHCGEIQTQTIEALEHEFGKWETITAPSCGKPGAARRSCAHCGEIQTQTIEALEHAFGEWKPVSAPSCDADGAEQRSCANCGQTQIRQLSAQGHTYGAWQYDGKTHTRTCSACKQTESGPHDIATEVLIQPSEENSGYLLHKCAVCGWYDFEWVPANGHTYGAWFTAIEASCGKSGTEQRVCSHCGRTEEREIAALEHAYGPWETESAASCEREGEERRICTLCGDIQTRTLAAGGHTFGPWVYDNESHARTCSACGTTERGTHTTRSETLIAATTESSGYLMHACTVCGRYRLERIPQKEHTFGDWETVTRPSCGQSGLERRACTVCGEVQTNTLPALEHRFGEWQPTAAASCEQDGTDKRTCSLCVETQTRIVPAEGHTFSAWEYDDDIHCRTCSACGKTERGAHTTASETLIAATTENSGFLMHTCTVCGRYRLERIPQAEHDFGNWTPVTQPSCDHGGLEQRVCKTCGEIQTHTVAALDHSFEEWETVIPSTCEGAGAQQRICIHCKETQVRFTGATGHTFDEWQERTAATCEQDGVAERRCDCGKTETKTILHTGHSLGEMEFGDEKHWRSCANCSEHLSENWHTYAYEMLLPATEETDGLQRTYCLECPYETTSPIPKIEHKFGSWEEIKPASCTEEGVEQRMCPDCGKTETQPIDKLPHALQETTKEATCTEDGYVLRQCKDCNYQTTETLLSLGGHALPKDISACHVDETLTAEMGDGYSYAGRCDRCGEALRSEEHSPAIMEWDERRQAWRKVRGAEGSCDHPEMCEECGETLQTWPHIDPNSDPILFSSFLANGEHGDLCPACGMPYTPQGEA